MSISILLGIAFGALFFILGIGGLIYSKTKRFYYLLPICIGGLIIYILTIGPLSSKKEHLYEIIDINLDNVNEIVLKPDSKTNNKYEFIKENLSIKKKESVKRICTSLLYAEKTYEHYIKDSDWSTLMLLKTSNDSILFEVHKSGKRTGLYVLSDTDSLNKTVTYKLNGLGSILETEIE